MASRPASALRAAEEAARSLTSRAAATRSSGTSFSTLAAASSSADYITITIRAHSSSLSRNRNYQCLIPSQQCYAEKIRCFSTHRSVDSDDSSGDNDEDEWNYDDGDENDQQQQPWKTLLEMPARAAWRASEPQPPPAVVKAQTNILDAGGASAKQLRQTYEGIAASHRALAERRERERRRMVNNTRYSKRAQLKDEEILPVLYGRMETLANLRNRLAPNYAITKRVLEECQSLLAYHNKNDNTSWKPKRVIDIGIGSGSASAAALEVFNKDIEWIHGIDPSKCMRECAQEFLEEIMEQQTSDRINPPRLTLSGSISAESSSTSTSAFDMALMTYTATELPHVGSTLAAAAILWEKMAHNGIFVMIEPGTPDGFNSIRAVRNMLLDCCPPHPKTKDNSDSDFEEEQPPVLDQCHIIAPCTHNGKCPMERHQQNFFKSKKSQPTYQEIEDFEIDDDDFDEDELDIPGEEESAYEASGGLVEETDFLNTGFCSFVQTMSTGSHLSKGEKFSYLVAQKRITSKESADKEVTAAMQSTLFQEDSLADLLARVYKANQDPDENDNAAKNEQRKQVQTLFEEALALEARYLDSDEDDLGLELLQGDAHRTTFGRIIRAPTKKRGHVYIDYCSAPGRLMRSRVSKALDYGVAPGLFTVARKSRWGGFWPDVSTQLSSNANGVEPTAEQNKDDEAT